MRPTKPVQETAKEKGDRLEYRVVKLYKRLGKWNVQHDVTLKDKYGNISQIDVIYGLLFRKYVECKNYAEPVALEKVAKFKEVLLLNGISPRRGVFITTSTYVPRARTIGIKTIDGDQLKRIEKYASSIFMVKTIVKLVTVGAIGYAAYVHRNYLQDVATNSNYRTKEYKRYKKQITNQYYDIKQKIKRWWDN